MLEYLGGIVIIALTAGFILAALRKLGALDWLQVHASSDFAYKLLSCCFCLTWWTSLVIAIVVALVMWDFRWLLFAPAATMIGVKVW